MTMKYWDWWILWNLFLLYKHVLLKEILFLNDYHGPASVNDLFTVYSPLFFIASTLIPLEEANMVDCPVCLVARGSS